MAEGDKEMNLRYAGNCSNCGDRIERGERAIYNQFAKNVRHINCSESVSPLDPGVAGESALREYERRRAKEIAQHDADVAQSRESIQAVFGAGVIGRIATFLAVNDSPPKAQQSTKSWQIGAVGEERVGARLKKLEPFGVVTLNDRKIPGSRANIDHLVISPWGVWVIDSKRYVNKKVDFKIVDSFFGVGGRKRLLVGGRDQTHLIDGVESQITKVRNVLEEPIDIKGCLCFVEADWPLLAGDFSVRGVRVCWPGKLSKTILRIAEPIIDSEAIARALAAKFPAA